MCMPSAFQSSIYQEVMAMFREISMMSGSPYNNADRDEKVKGYRYVLLG